MRFCLHFITEYMFWYLKTFGQSSGIAKSLFVDVNKSEREFFVELHSHLFSTRITNYAKKNIGTNCQLQIMRKNVKNKLFQMCKNQVFCNSYACLPWEFHCVQYKHSKIIEKNLDVFFSIIEFIHFSKCKYEKKNSLKNCSFYSKINAKYRISRKVRRKKTWICRKCACSNIKYAWHFMYFTIGISPYCFVIVQYTANRIIYIR